MRRTLQISVTIWTTAFMMVAATEGASGQVLTLRQALSLALAHNRTIIFTARESYATSKLSLLAAEAAYDYHLDFSAATTRSYSKIAFENESFAQISRAQAWTPSLEFSRSLLTPLGSRTTLGLGMATYYSTLPSRLYQLTPELSFSLQQPLGRAGITAGHQDLVRAKASFATTELSFQLQEEQLILAVVNGYYQLWQAFKDIDRARRELASAQRVLEIAELRLKAKSLAESEVLNSRVQYVSAEDNLLVSENQLQNQQRRFAQLLGQDITNAQFTLDDSVAIDTLIVQLDEAIGRSLAKRRELEQARISLELAELGVASTASANDPVLKLSGYYQLDSRSDRSLRGALGEFPSNAWSIQAGISLPILDGGAAKSQLEIARSSRSIAENNLRLLRQDIALEIEQIWRGLRLNERRITTLKLNLQLAEEALKIAELRFQHGQISSNEVEQVRSRYLNTQESLDRARVSYKIESASLAKAMGELGEWVEKQ